FGGRRRDARRDRRRAARGDVRLGPRRCGGGARSLRTARPFGPIHPRWRGGSDPERSVFLSQRDVRELQFAKASIATGWSILLGELGLEAGDISQVLLA